MSLVAGPVTIITTGGPAGLAGFTATSFSAVSDAPPTVLVCLNRSSRVAPVLRRNGGFAVNVLSGGDESTRLADVFAGRTGLSGEARFSSGHWRSALPSKRGELPEFPISDLAIVSFACRLVTVTDVASHHILIGEVLDVVEVRSARPLIYRERRYQTL